MVIVIILYIQDQYQFCSRKFIDMQTIQNIYGSDKLAVTPQKSVFSKFFAWCNRQEKYRFGWVAAILAIQGCVLAPITVLAIAFSGNSMIFWGLLIGGMAASLIANLAAMPTKITIPVFFLSISIDITVIAGSVYAML